MKSLRVSQTAFFGHTVMGCMDPAPPWVAADSDCREAVRLIRDHDASCVIVMDQGQRIVGILTEHDVLRRVAFRADGADSVRRYMSAPVRTVRDADYLYHAIATMRRHNLRHLPVLDRKGALVGVLHLHRILESSMPHMLTLIERLTHEDTRSGQRQVKDAQVELAQTLLDDKVSAADVQSLLTHINNDIYRRLVERALSEMQEEGWGAPPVGFDVIVMGSGGRGESFLFPDQDNGFVLEDYPDKRHGQMDGYFIELAARMTRSLDQAGIRLCRGHVMATNPLWRKTLSQWRWQIDSWLRRPGQASLRFSDIFFDFRCVYGTGHLGETLRQHFMARIPEQHAFLQEMERIQHDHGVALGPFNRLVPDQQAGSDRNKLNLKYHGLLPLVECVRLLSLRQAVAETSTQGRLTVLRDKGVLDHNEHDYLFSAFSNLTAIVLRQQLADYRMKLPVGAHVSPDVLFRRERSVLVESFKAIQALRARVHAEFTANVF